MRSLRAAGRGLNLIYPSVNRCRARFSDLDAAGFEAGHGTEYTFRAKRRSYRQRTA